MTVFTKSTMLSQKLITLKCILPFLGTDFVHDLRHLKTVSLLVKQQLLNILPRHDIKMVLSGSQLISDECLLVDKLHKPKQLMNMAKFTEKMSGNIHIGS